YLGFIFDSKQQSVSIPPNRRRSLFSLIKKLSRKSHCSIGDFASRIGFLVSVFPALQYSSLYTKSFERKKFLALNSSSGDYSRQMVIPSHLQDDFDWWLKIFSDTNQFNPICSEPFVCEIYSDASLTDWGAACDGQRTHGWPFDVDLFASLINAKVGTYVSWFSQLGFLDPNSSFLAFFDRPDLCIINILDHYLQRTRDLRPLDCKFL
ncbi:hypothetical protein ALC60_03895, partial [Trachymyrmex zeteki]